MKEPLSYFHPSSFIIHPCFSRRRVNSTVMPLHLIKPKKRLSLLLLVVVVNFSVVRADQNPAFDSTRLSPKGRTAYQKLLSAGVFSVGGVGYAGATSEEELALYDLLEENDSIESLKSLVRDASFEGGLYGLLGLSITNVTEFNRAVEAYKSREDPPPKESKEPFIGIKVPRNHVVTQFGCIVLMQDRAKLVASIQAGRFDKILRPRKG